MMDGWMGVWWCIEECYVMDVIVMDVTGEGVG
jgi:hypothetical protein